MLRPLIQQPLSPDKLRVAGPSPAMRSCFASAPHGAPSRGCLRACASTTGCNCAETTHALAFAHLFDCALDGSLRARTALAYTRLAFGVALLAFAIWSWSGAGPPRWPSV